MSTSSWLVLLLAGLSTTIAGVMGQHVAPWISAAPPPPAGSLPVASVTKAEVLVDAGTGELGRLILAAAPRIKVTTCDVAELVRSDRSPTSLSARVIVVGCSSCRGQPSEGIIERLRRRYPHVSVWVCSRPEDGAGARLVRYARAGAGRLFELGAPTDLAALVEALSNRVRAPAPGGLIWSVASTVRDPESWVLAIDCLVESFRRRLVSDVERHFGHDHKTLNRMLERANLVTIGHLQRAGTLAHDRELAKTGRLSREQIARLLGFDSSKHLAEMWRTAKRSGLVRAGEIVVFLD